MNSQKLLKGLKVKQNSEIKGVKVKQHIEYKFVNFEDQQIVLQNKHGKKNYVMIQGELKAWFKENDVEPVKIHDMKYLDVLYGCQLKNDGIQRIQVVKNEKKNYKVYAVDLGFNLNAAYGEIFELPAKFKSIHYCMESFYLNNFKLYPNDPQKIFKWLKDRLQNKQVAIEKFSIKKSGRDYANVFEGDSNILEELASKGFGKVLPKSYFASKVDVSSNDYMDKTNKGFRTCGREPGPPLASGVGQSFSMEMPQSFNTEYGYSMIRKPILGREYPPYSNVECGPFANLDRKSLSNREYSPYSNIDRGPYESLDRGPFVNTGDNRYDFDCGSRRGRDQGPFGNMDRGPYLSSARRPPLLGMEPADPRNGSFDSLYRNDSGESGFSAPFSVIPGPTFIGKPLDHNRKEVSILKGQLKAYEHTLRSEQMHNFARQPLSACKLLHDLVSKNAALLPFISDESALVKSVFYLLEDTSFHCLIDSAIQESNDFENVRKKIKSNAKHGSNLNLFERVQHALQAIFPINIEEIVISLQILESKLMVSTRELKNDAKSLLLDFRQNQSEEYAALTSQFLNWKNRYLDSHKRTIEAAGSLGKGLKRCGSFFEGVYEGAASEVPTLDCEDFQSASDAFLAEAQVLREICIIPSSLDSILNEIQLRLSKALKVKEFSTELKSLDAEFIPENSSQGRTPSPAPSGAAQENVYPSLLSFIRRSEKMHPKTKCLIVKDVFKELSNIHNNLKRCYGFLTPENVLLKFEDGQGAVLRTMGSASQYEPFPPFRFIAPEFDVSAANLLNASTILSAEITSALVDLSVDFYSLGQLIVWMMTVDFKGDFYEHMQWLRQQNPLLQSLSSPNPEDRPTLEALKERLDELLTNVFQVTGSAECNDTTAPVHEDNNQDVTDSKLTRRDVKPESQALDDIDFGRQLRLFSEVDKNKRNVSLPAERESELDCPKVKESVAPFEEVLDNERLVQQLKEEEELKIMQEMMSSDDDSISTLPLEPQIKS